MADLPDDLDQLLDSALDDFQNVNLNPSPQRVQGLGMNLPDLRSTKKAKQKASREAHVSEALDKLREQTRDSTIGLQAMNSCKISEDDLSNEELVEDWVKQFEQLAGSPDSETVVEMMMQQLLSKEILHEPMKEMEDRYLKWLEDYGASLSTEEYNRYSGQYKLIKDLNAVYENDPNKFQHIGELMQKIQEFGHPPDDIVQDHVYDFNLLNFNPLSGDMLQSQKLCSIMRTKASPSSTWSCCVKYACVIII